MLKFTSNSFLLIAAFLLIFHSPSSFGKEKIPDELIPSCLITEPSPLPCKAIVEFKKDFTSSESIARLQKMKVEVRHVYQLINAVAVQVPTEEALKKLLEMQDKFDEATIHPDQLIKLNNEIENTIDSTPESSDSLLHQVIPENIKHIGAAPGSSTWTGKGIGVAVIDTGLDFENSDLGLRTPMLGTNCFSAFSTPGGCQDDHGHGTHIAGILAARDNKIGVVGVAPEATLYAVRSFRKRGSHSSDMLAGIEWVLEKTQEVSPPIRVINLSASYESETKEEDSLLLKLLQLAHDRNITIVNAVTNDPHFEVTEKTLLAGSPEIIAVASTTAIDGTPLCTPNNSESSSNIDWPEPKPPYPTIFADTASFFTGFGPAVSISAPGDEIERFETMPILPHVSKCRIYYEGILSLKLGGGLVRIAGSSMAAPHVTGVVALMLQKADAMDCSLTPQKIKEIIQKSASRMGEVPLDNPAVVLSSTHQKNSGKREGIVSAINALEATCENKGE